MRDSYPSLEPDPEARLAAKTAIVGSRPGARPNSKRLIAAFGLAGTALLVVASILYGPSAYAQYRIGQIEGSVTDVHTAEMTATRYNSDGSVASTGHSFFKNGMWRFDSGDRTEIHRNGIIYIYRRSEKSLRTIKAPADYLFKDGSRFTIDSIVAMLSRPRGHTKATFETGTLDGRDVEIGIVNYDDLAERTILYADPTNHLLLEIHNEQMTASGWSLRGVTKPKFNIPIADSEFALNFPTERKRPGPTRVERSFLREIERPLKSVDVNHVTVRIRLVEMTPRGHVFIVYTDGFNEADNDAAKAYSAAWTKYHNAGQPKGQCPIPPKFKAASFEVSDSIGTNYVRSVYPIGLTVGQGHEFARLAKASDGEILRCEWFIPDRTTSWKPRELTLQLGTNGGPKWPRVSFRFNRPNSGDIPYWANFSIGQLSEVSLLSAERETQLWHLKSHRQWKTVVAYLRAELEGRKRKHESDSNAQIYYDLYDASKRAGNLSEAITYLRLAAKEPIWPGKPPETDIKAALRAEGLK